MQKQEPKKTAIIGGQIWILPFRQNHRYVEDAKRNNFAECQFAQVASELAKHLNELHPLRT